jgi:hypothetical protein
MKDQEDKEASALNALQKIRERGKPLQDTAAGPKEEASQEE